MENLSCTAGLGFRIGDGVADSVIKLQGTAAAINAALNGLVYTPAFAYNGVATLTLTTADSTFVPLRFGPHSPDVLYNPPTPDYGPAMQKLEQTMVPQGVMDPTLGLYSPTDGAKGAPLTNTFSSGMADIVAGRRPIGDVQQVINEWKAGGGDQIRAEYEAALAAA